METSADWQALEDELAHWHRAGRVATLWWRDDDAARVTGAVERLVDLSRRRRVPLALAVVPMQAERALDSIAARAWRPVVLQHGYAHRDYAARDEPAAELGEHRAAATVLSELAEGRELMRRRFGTRFLPVLVPPWNRIAAGLLPRLVDLGYRGLSRFAARETARLAPRLVQVNCHVDPVDWKAGAAFRGEDRCLGELAGHLRARREGRADSREPTGLLTHHLVHAGDAWGFLDALLERLLAHPAVRWLDPRQVFAA